MLCGRTLDGFQLKVVESFFKPPAHNICACVVDTRPPQTILQRIKKNLRMGRGAYILIMALEKLLERRKYTQCTEEYFTRKNIPILTTARPYSEDTINRIKSFNPDVMVLIGGFGIIKKPLLDLSKNGIISYHHGNMRKYRGQPPCFWELFNGEKEMGITVQRLNAGLDCGEPIVEKTIPISRSDTLHSLKKRAFEESIGMMREAITFLEEKRPGTEKLTMFGYVYTIPNFRQWFIYNMKIAYRLIRYGCIM
jgi:folate-dependent phosphoribosylglycinamide formyltransferase PurN